ncbi:actin-binding protein IPP-like isoform X2 [Planococcus citri]|uniref:actin-binding protein IPP-like isoform X2 n=1 Tax=Planococcus citri TaxID=170843 RepID=UPI0031F7B499
MSAKECCEKYAHSPVPVTVTHGPYSKHHDISVKVGEEIFPLNRLQLALVSSYFEKLFTEYYAEKDSKLVEIGVMDSKTFSTIVDIINGKDLESLINADNYVSLLMGMDYLQMEIRLFDFKFFIEQYAGDLPFDPQIFQLFSLICCNQSYEYLRSTIYTYLFHHIVELPKYQEFFFLQLDDLIDIIEAAQPRSIRRTSSLTRYSNTYDYEMNAISQMCSKWICHDVEKRRRHFLALVNAANCRLFNFSFQISPSNASSVLSKMEEYCQEEEIQTCFYQLLNYNGQIIDHPEDEQPRKRRKRGLFPYTKLMR